MLDQRTEPLHQEQPARPALEQERVRAEQQKMRLFGERDHRQPDEGRAGQVECALAVLAEERLQANGTLVGRQPAPVFPLNWSKSIDLVLTWRAPALAEEARTERLVELQHVLPAAIERRPVQRVSHRIE